MTKFFFTFGVSGPYGLHYVEIDTTGNPYGHLDDRGFARELMIEAHGTKWAFQYDEAGFEEIRKIYDYKRLAVIKMNEQGTWRASSN